MKPITLEQFAQSNGLKQVVVTGWDGHHPHLISYGVTPEDQEAANKMANVIKKHLEPEAVPSLTPACLFLVAITEHERGWGQRPDGFLAFPTEELALTYISAEYSKRGIAVPDVYETYTCLGYHPVGPETAARIKGVTAFTAFYADKKTDFAK